MADFTNSKSGIGSPFPDNAQEAAWGRVEPLVGAQQVRNRHLFGIPLVSAMKDPLTGKAQVMTDEILKDVIDRAVSLVEMETGLVIFPTQLREKHAFDRHLYESFGYLRLERRPATTVHKISITPATGQDIFLVPLDWLETAYLPRGQINLVPMVPAMSAMSMGNASGTAGAVFMQILGSKPWIPAFWQIEYTAGYPDGMLPKPINELIGVVAAIEALSMLGATYAKSTSHSIGIDGMSQSVSTPGPALFQQRLQELGEKRKALVGKLKAAHGLKLFSGEV